MAAKEQLEQLRSMIVPEKMEQASSILKGLENEYIDLVAGKSASDSESKNRKLKIREQDGVLEDRDIKISELQKKIDSFDDLAIKKERDTYSLKYKNALKFQQDYFKNNFEVIEKHPKFEEILKTKFKIPEKDGDKYSWDKLKDEDWEQNIQTFNELNSLKYFEATQKLFPDLSKGGHNRDGVRIPTIEEAMEIRTKYGPDSKEYKHVNKLRNE